MRELSMVELEQVNGAGAPVIAVIVLVGTVAVGGMAVVAYGVSKGCSGSMEVGTDGVKLEVSCPGGKD